jgi:23S rRNA pseudouridine1911/1915/1917 synthase
VNRKQIVADAATSGQRLDRFVCAQIPSLGRAAARRLIEAGEIRVNGRRAAPGRRLQAGDVVELELASASSHALPDPEAQLTVVYEDAWLVAADKSAGMPSHPLRPGERGTLASALLARYPELHAVGYGAREPGLVHRLDTGTSGLVLAARDAETWRVLREALQRGAIDKRYVALCSGTPAAPASHEAWLSARGARVTVRDAPFGGAARVHTEILEAAPAGSSGLSLLTVRAHFARRHQVRAHLAALGHPIAGDLAYGGAPLPGLARQFLHASELRFAHPHGGAPLRLCAALPSELEAVLAALRGGAS